MSRDVTYFLFECVDFCWYSIRLIFYAQYIQISALIRLCLRSLYYDFPMGVTYTANGGGTYIQKRWLYILRSRTTISQDVQTRFPVQLAFAKFLSKIKGNFESSIMDTALPQKIPFILDRNLAKANYTGNRVRTSCDIVVLT